MPRKSNGLPTQMYLKSILDYNPDTGVFCWLPRPETSKWWRYWNKRMAGKTAGCFRQHGYVAIRIDGREYLAHRLAWVYVYGVEPTEEIDHKNLSRSDNSIANLREATRTENNRNGTYKRSNSLPKGVYLANGWKHKARRYGAQIKFGGKTYKLGTFDTVEEAHAAYVRAAKEAFGEFARA